MQILVVDDSKAMRSIVMRAVRQAGYEAATFVEATNGAEALKLIRASPPALVLADWNMPEMSGIELLKTLRAEGNAIKVGFVTSESDPAMRDIVIIAFTAFAMKGDEARMVGFMGANLGDHFQAAVDNVLAVGSEHFEQAVYADGLSDASLAQLRELGAITRFGPFLDAEAMGGAGMDGMQARLAIRMVIAPRPEEAPAPLPRIRGCR